MPDEPVAQTTHPADMRWQLAKVRSWFWPAVRKPEPDARDNGRLVEHTLIWVRTEDFLRFREWHENEGAR